MMILSKRFSVAIVLLFISLLSAGRSFSETEDERNNIAVYEKAADGLMHYIRERKPGDTITLRVYRKGSFSDLKVVLGEKPRAR
jgi:hypothetical protein